MPVYSGFGSGVKGQAEFAVGPDQRAPPAVPDRRQDTATAAPGTWYSASFVASRSSSHFWISLRVAIPEP